MVRRLSRAACSEGCEGGQFARREWERFVEREGLECLAPRVASGKLSPTKACILKTDRTDLGPERLRSLYMMLVGVETSFRYLKTALGVRPIFHQLQHRSHEHM